MWRRRGSGRGGCFPLDGFNPNTYSRMVVTYVIMMKGMNTMNHESMVRPPMHS